jgi:hypothetical protein
MEPRSPRRLCTWWLGCRNYLNLNARLQYQAMQLGDRKVTYLDAEESKRAVQDYERSWDYWKFKLAKQ